jgi:hypothetical protein
MVYVTKTRGERVVETVEFSPEKFTLQFPSAQDLATQATAELTHALLHPQPAGTFCKVGDEQTIALERLADIFEGTTQQKSKVVIPPPTRWKMMHLQGCKTQFHLRGWQIQRQDKYHHRQPHNNIQRQILIADNKPMPDVR